MTTSVYCGGLQPNVKRSGLEIQLMIIFFFTSEVKMERETGELVQKNGGEPEDKMFYQSMYPNDGH